MSTFETEIASTFSQHNSPTQVQSSRLDKFNMYSPKKTQGFKSVESHREETNRTFQSSSPSRNLAEIKERRRLVESNAQLLSNRLQALANEEHKLKRNASEIKKKAQTLLNHRVNRDKIKNKEQMNFIEREKLKSNDLNNVKQAVAEAREKARLESERLKKLLEEKKKREAQEIRLMRINNEEKIGQARLQHLNTQRNKSQRVKEAENLSVLKIREYHQVKAEIFREEKERILQEEEEKVLERERDVERLAEREDAMLRTLVKAQDDENNAHTEFDEISTLPVDDLTEKYSYYLKSGQGGKSMRKWPSDASPSNFKSFSLLNQSKSGKIAPLNLKSNETMKLSYVSN